MGVRVRFFIFASQMGVLHSSDRKYFLAWGGMWEACSVHMRRASGEIFGAGMEPNSMVDQAPPSHREEPRSQRA